MKWVQAKCHTVFVGTTCQPSDNSRLRGDELIGSIEAALCSDPPVRLGESFAKCGTTCMASCGFPHAVALTAGGKHTTVFGDIGPETDASALLALAALHHKRIDGFTRAAERPENFRHKTIAHPAAEAEEQSTVRGHGSSS